MATLAAALEYDLPDKNAAEDSHNLLPLLEGTATEAIRTTHVHNTNPNDYAIRHEEWLLVAAPDGYVSNRDEAWEKKHGYPADDKAPVELYNLKSDPGQRQNIADQYPEKAAALKLLLGKMRTEASTAPRLRNKK